MLDGVLLIQLSGFSLLKSISSVFFSKTDNNFSTKDNYFVYSSKFHFMYLQPRLQLFDLFKLVRLW